MKMRQQILYEIADGGAFLSHHFNPALIHACLEDGDAITILQPYERCPWYRGEGAEDANI